MSASGFTPISLYYSTTASAVPTAANLVPGELAINTADGKLYYEDSSGVVQVLATKSTGSIGGSNTQVQFNNSGSLGGSSGLTWDGSALTTSRLALGGTTLPSAGTAILFSRTSDNNTYLQTGSGNNFILLDGSQNTMATFSPTALSFNISNTNKLTLNSTTLYTASGVNVGIGTSSPATKLVVYDTTAPQVTFDNGTSTFIVGNNVSGNNHILYGTGAYPMIFYTNATQAMTLDASGNLLVGCTTVPSIAGGSASSGVALIPSGALVAQRSAATVAYLGRSNDGEIMALYSGATQRGAVSIAGATTTYGSISDYRLKENEVSISNALNRVALLKPYRLNFKEFPNETLDSFFAHELGEVVPQAMIGTKDDVDSEGKPIYQSADFAKVVPLLTAAIQEQQVLIQSLSARLTAAGIA